MDVILLDTNIVSFLLKGDSRVEHYARHLQGHRLALSFMTVAELFQWAFVRGWGARRQQALEASLEKYVVLPYDIVLCRHWGEIRAACRAQGRPISPQDGWIAATALRYELTLVTHNPGDFEPVEGLRVITEVT
jgi:predicted nucleic acid-binding protein